MPRQIILPPAAARDRYHQANASVGIRLDLWGIPALSVAVYYWRTWLTSRTTMMLVLGSAFSLVMLVRKRSNDVNERSRVPAVAVYPVGLQLCTIPSSSTERKDSEYVYIPTASSKITPGIFFPREIVLDCVVAEIVYSYKVESFVFLRLCKDAENQTLPTSQDESAAKLMAVFPNVHMTYMECLAVRSQINEYLLYS
jgi:hypothetical protein